MSIIPNQLFLYLLLASVIALGGGLLFLYVRKLSTVLERWGVPFAAGTMIITALVGLLPEANHLLGASSFAVFAVAFVCTFVFEQLLTQLHHHDHSEHSQGSTLQSSVPMVLIGDTIHNLIDGVAIATAYLVNPGLAFATAVSTFLHEVPHEIGDFSILLKAGWKRGSIVLINIVSALSTLLGGVLVYQFSIGEVVQGYLLAITAGIFFYLGAIDFLPHAFEKKEGENWQQSLRGVIPVLAGAVIMLGTLGLVPHSHDHGYDHVEERIHDEHEEPDHDEPDGLHHDEAQEGP
ncbi:MAG: ZIP family metal transporter [Pseudomonadales bacterium]|nr:ZIP family metal transporter [Candidatus Woesebacteria bacterium]MCB9801576.1 ZIP family metal transporter [Pseudomonadales bacterium]